MKKLLIVFIFLFASTISIDATENNGVGEVKSGLQAVLSLDNDSDGINDRNDQCKNTAVTPTYIDENLDGCDDNTMLVFEEAALQNGSTTEEVQAKKPGNGNGNPGNGGGNPDDGEEVDSDGDGIEDGLDGCSTADTGTPSVDENLNGCEDNTIRTMYVSNTTYDDYFTISGYAFVDGQDFSDPNTYTIEIGCRNITTNAYVAGEVTNYEDDSVNDWLIGVPEDQDISYSYFEVTFMRDDFEEKDNNKDDEYVVEVTLVDQNGVTYTENLFSFTDFGDSNDDVARIESVGNRIQVEIK